MKVLIPIDIAHPHEDLSEHLGWLLPAQDADITLLYVKEILPSYERLVASMGDFPDDWTHQVDKKAHEVLDPLKQKLEQAGAKAKVEIASGPPEHLIASVARDRKVELTVVAPGQKHNIEKFFMGSTSSSVVKLAPGTILVLRDYGGHDKLTHAVFGVDGTEESIHALKTIVTQLKLAERQVKVTVLHAVAVPALVAMFAPPEMAVQLEKNMEMEGETILAGALKILKDLGVKQTDMRLVQGEPAAELIRYAEHANAELVAVGGGGSKFFEHALMGSAASRVVSHARCSVAVVKLPHKTTG